MLARCREFHCLPSEVYAESTDLIRLLRIEQRGRRDEEV